MDHQSPLRELNGPLASVQFHSSNPSVHIFSQYERSEHGTLPQITSYVMTGQNSIAHEAQAFNV